MGNSIGAKMRKKTAKVMKIDGTKFRLEAPVQARVVLRDHPRHDHPRHDLLDSEEVKRLGLRAQPLVPYQHLMPGMLYFLVELPRLPDRRAPRRAWSGELRLVGATDRLESLMLARRSVSDISTSKSSSSADDAEEAEGGVRVRVRLPKLQVARMLEESKDTAEVAEKIMKLYAARERAGPAKLKTEVIKKRTMFLPMPGEIIA